MADTQADTSTDVTSVTNYAPKNIPIESMLEYRKKGLTHADIAAIIGCDRSNVSRRLQPYKDDLDTLDLYKHHRADIIAIKGKQILNNITPDKIQKASAYQLTGMYSILFDKERLEREQSTANVSVRMATIAALQREIEDK